MATRLQADESGKEPKWADIDDDEDDWAPESVEWIDGTKSTVAAENMPLTPQEEVQQPMPAQERPDAPKSSTPSVQRPSSTSGSKTILKPGGVVQSPAGQTKPTNGLVLKGALEKPTLVAKPTTSVPVKSPWAALPPVDKVPPVAPPIQQPRPRFAQADPHGFDSLPPVSAAKEIAADDFNRAWRDEQTNRTLFDSKSGRYEPVNETRRGSVRDNGFRQPAVLQRPSQQDSRAAPAEPSAAFQTTRTSTEGSWGRRRASSSVSGGSGSLARRMSIGRPSDAAPPALDLQSLPRRESQSFVGSGVSPADSFRSGGPLAQGSQDARAYASPSTPRWQRPSPMMTQAQPAEIKEINNQQTPIDGEPSAVEEEPREQHEDTVAKQQRLMSEKIERARQAKQRRDEEERREELAKAERLRLKIASLEAQSPKPKDNADDTNEPTSHFAIDDDSTTIASSTKMAKPTTADQPPQTLTQPSTYSPSKPANLPSSSKPQFPSAHEEPSQFGLIKLHSSQSSRKPASDSSFSIKQTTAPSSTSLPPPPEGLRSSISSSKSSPEKPEPAPTAKTDTAAVAAPPSPAPWTAPNAGGNIWGASLLGTRTLGNGTNFNTMSTTTTTARRFKDFDPTQVGGRFINGEYLTLEQCRARGIGPAQPVNKNLAEWNNAAGPSGFQAQNKIDGQEQKAKIAKQEKEGVQVHIGLKSRHVITNPETGERTGEVNTVSRTDQVNRAGKEPIGGLANGLSQPAAAAPLNRAVGAERAQAQAVTKPVSRFFPTRAGSNSPPPPDALNNELMDGNPKVPGVKLPEPKPQVKLPPTPSTNAAANVQPGSAQPVTLPVLTSRPSVPIAQQPGWADKIQALLHSKTAPAPVKHHAQTPSGGAVQPVMSSSIESLDVGASPAISGNGATVSLPATSITPLPPKRYGSTTDSSSQVTSKTTAEEDFLEDREFGSRPVVKIPNSLHLAAHLPPVSGPAAPRHPNSRLQRPEPLEVHSIHRLPSPGVINVETNPSGTVTPIRLPGMWQSKWATVPGKTTFTINNRAVSGRGKKGGSNNKEGENSRPGSRKASNVTIPQGGQVFSPGALASPSTYSFQSISQRTRGGDGFMARWGGRRGGKAVPGDTSY